MHRPLAVRGVPLVERVTHREPASGQWHLAAHVPLAGTWPHERAQPGGGRGRQGEGLLGRAAGPVPGHLLLTRAHEAIPAPRASWRLLSVDEGSGTGTAASRRLVYSCVGAVNTWSHIAGLDELTRAEHGHAVGDLVHDREVVTDEDAREPELVLQVGEERQHVRLDRHVQGAGRLVRDQQPWPQRQCAGEGDPLPLATGELAWATAGVVARQTYGVEQVAHPSVTLGAGADLVHVQRFGDALRHGEQRVERGGRVLGHESQVLADLAQPAGGDGAEVLALDEHPTPGERDQAGSDAAEGGLAGTGLAHQARGPHRGATARVTVVDGGERRADPDGPGTPRWRPRRTAPPGRPTARPGTRTGRRLTQADAGRPRGAGGCRGGAGSRRCRVRHPPRRGPRS